MKGKIALVTGGMGGIGTAICQHFCTQGATVIAAYHRDHASAKAWQQQQAQQGFDLHINYVDVADYESCGTLIQQIEEQFQRIDILVNNAGIASDSLLVKMKPAQWQRVLRTNLDGIFNVTQHAIQTMLANHYGRIINIASINGQKGQFGQTNYSASKAGVHGFTKSLAQEVARKGITVNTVSPGYVATDMVMAVSETVLDKIIAQIPIGRLGKPAEIAHLIGFLASSASTYITGADFSINGGLHMA